MKGVFDWNRKYLILFLILFSLSLVSAVQTTTQSINLNGTSSSQIITFTSSLSPNITILDFSLSSSLSNAVQLSLSQLSIVSSGTLTASLKSNPPSGSFLGNLFYTANDGTSGSIPLLATIVSTGNNPNDCQLNPSLASYNQIIQSGSEIPLPKITFSPTNCQGNIIYDASHIYVEGGIVIGGLQRPLSISSIVSDGVNLDINTAGLSSQTYQTKLKINAFNKNFEIPINIIVTGSSGTMGNLSDSSVPSCSLNSINLNLNGTYSLICSQVTDVVITPRVDNNYIIGIGREDSNTQYKWNFKAIFFGATTLYADFYYKNAPLGKSFSSEVKISPSGINIASGTNISLEFFQSGTKRTSNNLNPGSTILFPTDEKTSSVIPSYDLYINGNKIINNSYNFEAEKVYEIRVSAVPLGYIDLVISNLTVIKNEITISLTPSLSEYQVGDVVNITTDPVNASLILNGGIITSPYTFSNQGNYVLKADKEGYIPREMNITVKSFVNILGSTPLYEEWKSGSKVIIEVDKNITWQVSRDGSIIASGDGTTIQFKISDSGNYVVSSGNNVIISKVITKTSFWQKIKNISWWVWVIIVVVILFIVFLFYKRSSGGEENTAGFELSQSGD